MKTFRRPLLDPIRNKSGYVAQAQQMQRDIRDLQRAPVRIPPTQVIVPQRKPLPPPTPSVLDLYLMACDVADTDHQYLLKLAGGAWTVVDHGSNLLPLVGGENIDAPPVGGLARQFGTSLWASGGGLDTTIAWRSDDGGLTWAAKANYPSVTDYPHGLAVTRDAAGNVWWAEREASDIFRFKKSTDNGDTGSTSLTGDDDLDSPYHAAAHQTDANIVAFAGYSGASPDTTIWVTIDGGASWDKVVLNTSAGPLTDSTSLLFTDTGDLIYATADVDSPNEILRVYKASAPYSSFAETDLITANVSLFEGPYLAASPNPQFLGMTWFTSGAPHGRVWRATGGAWTELAEPFAADMRLYGICTNAGSLYAMAADPNNDNELQVAVAANAGSGSVTWSDITAAVNTAAGVTLAVLGASMLFEVSA